MNTHDRKPARPFGVTLAILLCVLFFSVIPLISVGSRVMIERHIAGNQTFMMPDGSTVDAVSGVDEGGALDDGAVRVQIAVSVVFIVVAFFAWRGRSNVMRYLFMAAVIGIALVLLYQNFVLFRDSGFEGGTGAALLGFVRNINILFLILLPAYVVWYLNRAPARAFYRGYYLKKELDWLAAQDED